jgi:predicted secreted protein
MTTAVGIGSGAQFWLDNASDVLTQLSEIISVSCPNLQIEDVEATHMGSGEYREFVAGLKDPGEGTFEMNYVPNSATDVLIRAAVNDGNTRDFKIVLQIADGSTQEITGDCIVKGYERNVPIDDRMTATMTVRFTGASSETHV